MELYEEYPGHQTVWSWTSSSDGSSILQTSAEVVEAKGEITVTFTMPNANTEITKIEVQ